MMFILPARAKKRAYKSSFNGTVISTMIGEKRDHRVTIEIKNEASRCFILVSPIKNKKLHPQYLDSIFKAANAEIIYLKKDQTKEIVPMDDIDCLDIDCREEK